MPKIVSKALQVRMNYQAQQGRKVTAREVAEATGISEATLSRIEQGKTERIDFSTLLKLCSFYDVGVGDLLEYDPDGRLWRELAASVQNAN